MYWFNQLKEYIRKTYISAIGFVVLGAIFFAGGLYYDQILAASLGANNVVLGIMDWISARSARQDAAPAVEEILQKQERRIRELEQKLRDAGVAEE